MPSNINNVVFTAPNGLGSASIDGPGDLAGANLEGVFILMVETTRDGPFLNLTFNQFDFANRYVFWSRRHRRL
ncbi:MAG: hypothetical protein IPH94_15345 [Saprospiraceae bacterium]|nr:hypothetical protein [Saprospiraceae bacterium]